MDDNESYPNKVEKMLLVTDPEKKKADLAKVVSKKKKQQPGAELKVEARGTRLMEETFETSTVFPVPSTGYLLDYLNQTEKTLMVKEKDDTESITTETEFFKELEWLDLERETLASNTNQAEMDDIDITVTKTGFIKDLEQFDLERDTLAGNNNQAEKITLTDDTRDTTTKAEFSGEMEQFNLD